MIMPAQYLLHTSAASTVAQARAVGMEAIAPAHAVGEVGQPVFMKRSRKQRASRQGEQCGHKRTESHRGEPQHERKQSACEIACDRPQLHYALIVSRIDLHHTPERQTCKE